MFSPMQKAHGPEAISSCPRCPPAPRSTWSGHMVRSHGLQPSMTLKFDISLKKLLFFNIALQMCVN